MARTKKKSRFQEESEVETQEEGQGNFIIMQPPETPEIKMRKLGLIGDVDEEKSAEVIHGLYILKEMGRYEVPPATKRSKPKVGYDPIDFIISTHGGSASDMFAIYDVMRDVRQECEIATMGVGKVMSAGVLLLAAGTKGKRKIGKNCRVMMHSVIGGNSGPIFNLENEMKEVRATQERYIAALKSETKMSIKQINNFFNRHVDIYLSAEEAVKLGIADIVV